MPDFSTLRLVTSKLNLRPLRGADAPSLLAIFSDPKVMRYWSTTPWTSMEDAEHWIEVDRVALPSGDFLRLGIERLEDEALLGVCTLYGFNGQCRRAEIGYALASVYWGRGYMYEALAALLEYGFRELQLNRVEADVDPRNLASLRCLQRLGFVAEGRLRERWIVGGEVCDSLILGLLARDWRGVHTSAFPRNRPDASAEGTSGAGMLPETEV